MEPTERKKNENVTKKHLLSKLQDLLKNQQCKMACNLDHMTPNYG